jgi:hypothetical protein
MTDRDREILETLTLRVRMLSVAQVARTFWSNGAIGEANSRRRLSQLDDAGLVHRLTVMARPELNLTEPLIDWRPGLEAPALGQVAYKLKRRWTEPVRSTAVVIATARAASQLGGTGGRRPRASEITHDLHMATVYLLARTDHARSRRWISEAAYSKRWGKAGERVPDAALLSSRGGRKKLIEVGGAYPKRKLEGFHRFCEDQELGYELW